MAASLVYGTSFELVETVSLRGVPTVALVPVDGGGTSIAWSSVREIEERGAALGIPKEVWPFFPEIEAEIAVPLEEVVRRCDRLRDALRRIDRAATEGDDWFEFFRDILAAGKSFFVFV